MSAAADTDGSGFKSQGAHTQTRNLAKETLVLFTDSGCTLRIS